MGFTTIILIGSQGSGKGTQSRRLKEYLEKEGAGTPVFLFSMGERFREFIKEDGLTQGLVREYLDRGSILPVFLPVWLWTSLFIRYSKGNEYIIFDGSPRTLFEAEILESAFEFYGRENIIVFSLSLSREEAVRRLMSRNREDDTEEAIRERLSWFDKNTIPALSFFQENPRYHLFPINGEQDADGVFNEITSKLKNL